MSEEDKQRMRSRYERGNRRQEVRAERSARWQKKRAGEPENIKNLRHKPGERDDPDWHNDHEDWRAIQALDPDDPQFADEGGFRPKSRQARRERRRRRRSDDEEHRPDAAAEGSDNALITAVQAGRVEVRLDHQGQRATAVLIDALRQRQQTDVAVGDRAVVVDRGDGGLELRAIAPRRSSLSRPDPGNPNLQRTMVANVDLALLVTSWRAPDFRPGWVDRVLTALGSSDVPQRALCINKADLAEQPKLMDSAAAVYRALGVHCLFTSATTGYGMAELRALLKGRTTILFGHSGVGKSALLNALNPSIERATGAGRAFDGKGRHTTRGSRLSVIDANTQVVDTPGVRTFGLLDQDDAALARHFPDFATHEGCRYADCLHIDEPGCTVLEAMQDGALPFERYRAYLHLRRKG